MDFYRSLIADYQKRISLKQNDLIEFNFNNSIFSLQCYHTFYIALAQVALTDVMTNNIQQGVISCAGRALTVRIHKIQRFHHFDKYLILVKPLEEDFDFEQTFSFEELTID